MKGERGMQRVLSRVAIGVAVMFAVTSGCALFEDERPDQGQHRRSRETRRGLDDLERARQLLVECLPRRHVTCCSVAGFVRRCTRACRAPGECS